MGNHPKDEWDEKYGDIDPYENDEKPPPSEWEGDKPTDSRGRQYNPYAGSQTPTPGRCNRKLRFWEERYGEPRYCCQIPQKYKFPSGSEYCRNHKGQENLDMKAQELFEHGAFSKSLGHFFEKISPLERVLAWAMFADLLEQSIYDFEPEWNTETFDFSLPSDIWEERYKYEKHVPPEIRAQLDDDDVLHVEVPNVTEYQDQAMALWNAALDGILMTRMNATRSKKGGQSITTEHAQLTAPPSEHDSSPQKFKTIEEWTEHHLNLPYSRLVRDRKELLEYGGVGVEEAKDHEPEAVIEYYDDPLATEPSVVETH